MKFRLTEISTSINVARNISKHVSKQIIMNSWLSKILKSQNNKLELQSFLAMQELKTLAVTEHCERNNTYYIYVGKFEW